MTEPSSSNQPSAGPRSLPTVLVVLLFHLTYLILPLTMLGAPTVLWWAGQGRVAVAWIATYLSWFAVTQHSELDGEGRPWPALENWGLWRHLFDWFPLRLVPPAEPLSPSRRYVFGVHPHGALAFNRAMFGFCTDQLWDPAFPGIRFRVLAATSAFRVPCIRELWLWSYCIDARKAAAVRALNKGYSLLLYPGGVKEQVLTLRGRHRVYLQNRKGFCKLALQHGCPLVPVYVFGETDLYHHWNVALPARQWMADRFGVAVMPITGTFGLLPYRVPVTGVSGPPIAIKRQVGHPSQKQIDDLHAAYVAALQDLFDTQKEACGYKDAVLEIL